MTYTANQLAKFHLVNQLEELLCLHSIFIAEREEVASKLLENSYPYSSFFNWLGHSQHKSNQMLLDLLKEENIEIRAVNKSAYEIMPQG